MEEFLSYKPEDIVLANLEELLWRMARCSEQETAHIEELAQEMSADISDGASLIWELCEHRLPCARELCDRIAWQSAEGLAFPEALSAHQKVRLCASLKTCLSMTESDWLELLLPDADDREEISDAPISYQKNNYTDLAFERFSAHLQLPRTQYAHGFESVCQDLFNGTARYGILPLESSTEGRLGSFWFLMEKYDLKICSTCSVPTGDGRETKFALLSRTLSSLTKTPDTLEFSCEIGEDESVSHLLLSADMLGLRTVSADISPSKSSGSTSLHAALSVGHGDLVAFLLYLKMEHPNANIIGHYEKL